MSTPNAPPPTAQPAEDEEKYFVAIEDGIDYARRHSLYRDHPDLATASFALRQLRDRYRRLRSEMKRMERLTQMANNLPDSFIAEIRTRRDLSTAICELVTLRNAVLASPPTTPTR